MKQCLKLNILNFEPEEAILSFSFYEQPSPGYISLSLSKAPIELKDSIHEDTVLEYLYTNFEHSDDADYTVEVDLKRSTNFAKHYYSHLIRKFLKDRVDLVNPNFINDIEAWVHEESLSTKQFKAYRVYGIRVQIAKITKMKILKHYQKSYCKFDIFRTLTKGSLLPCVILFSYNLF